MPDSSHQSTRKRGGQPGNLNAAKHGFYSRQFKPTDLGELDQSQIASLEQEIELLRISIRRLIEIGSEPQSMAQAADQLRTVCLALQTLTSLVRAQHFLFSHSGDFR